MEGHADAVGLLDRFHADVLEPSGGPEMLHVAFDAGLVKLFAGLGFEFHRGVGACDFNGRYDFVFKSR